MSSYIETLCNVLSVVNIFPIRISTWLPMWFLRTDPKALSLNRKCEKMATWQLHDRLLMVRGRKLSLKNNATSFIESEK